MLILDFVSYTGIIWMKLIFHAGNSESGVLMRRLFYASGVLETKQKKKKKKDVHLQIRGSSSLPNAWGV